MHSLGPFNGRGSPARLNPETERPREAISKENLPTESQERIDFDNGPSASSSSTNMDSLDLLTTTILIQ